jgi:hypothetical protein
MRSLGRWALWVMISCVVVVLVARATAIRWWRVPAGDPYLEASIAPTLRGDLFSVPFPWWLGTLIGAACAELFWRIGAAPGDALPDC